MEEDIIIENINNNIPFLLARYNDGEFIAITQWDYIYNCHCSMSPGNIDSHKYDKELGDVLREAILSDENVQLSKENKYLFQSKLSHYKNMLGNTFGLNVSSLDNIKFNVNTITKDFTDFIYSNPQKFIECINLLNNKYIVLIGPEYLKYISFLNVKQHIIIPQVNCFSDKDNIIKNIVNEMNRRGSGGGGGTINNEHKYFIFCASMTTNYIIEKLKYLALNKHTMIDMGSCFDNFISTSKVTSINRRVYKPEYIKQNYPSNYWIE